MPLKLDFDESEDEYPEINDQRFYGFKQLSLANGFSDASFLRDAATSNILQEAGLPAAETAFYEVILDYGEGPVTLGLYTVIEVVDNTVIDRHFGSDEGNIYEGEGSAASFAASTYDQIEDSFQKENNEDEADWSDIEDLFQVLHSDERTSDPAAWRANLEEIFNVDAFLEWLAISAVIEHWDAYGNMNHNYYLYDDPDSGRLTWISWDHNMAMSTGMGGRVVSLDKVEINDNWPLIRFLLDDPVYYQRYLDYLAETVAGPFDADRMAEVYQEMADLISPYAAADVGQEAFDLAVQQLIDHAYQRRIRLGNSWLQLETENQMDETNLALDSMATNDARADWNLDTIAEQIFRSLDGSVTRKTILQIIEEVVPRYEDARIQTYVPILIQRDVMNELFTMRETLAQPGVGIKEVHQSERT